MEIDVRITLDDRALGVARATAVGLKGRELLDTDIEANVVHAIVADVPGAKSAVILRNNGFSHMLPDESTRQER